MDLCARCRGIRFNPLRASTAESWNKRLGPDFTFRPGQAIYTHSASLGALEESARRTRCPFCRILEHHLKHFVHPFGRGYDEEGAWRPANEAESPVILYSSGAGDFSARCEERTLRLWKVSLPKALEPFSTRVHDPSDTSTGSLKSLKLAKAWVWLCLLEHEQCASYCTVIPATLPTRVIDVGPPGPEQDPVLVVSGGREAHYVALSHCWGKANMPTTTTVNMAQRQQGIPLTSLPQNFRDAITVTKTLECRYLWIDSLCIVQDDPNDWDAESARMQHVYRYALVTIAVVRSQETPNPGCFAPRDGSLHRPVSLPIPADDEEGQGESLWEVRTRIRPEGPLYERGWVLQEQALSGRVLAYCDKGVYWSCLSRGLSEARPHEEDSDRGRDSSWSTGFKDLIVNMASQPVSGRTRRARHWRRAMYDTWYSVVEEYSHRKLSFATDKLYAISSLAEQMSHVLQDRYVAGLWRDDLVRGLLWERFRGSRDAHHRRRIRPPYPFIAPSWSWASVTGDFVQCTLGSTLDGGVIRRIIDLMARHEEDGDWRDEMPTAGIDDVEIIDILCTPAGENQYAQVSDGRISLRGHVRTAVFRHPGDLLDPQSEEEVGGVNLDEAAPAALDGQLVHCLFMARLDRPRFHGEDVESGDVHLALLPTGLGRREFRRIGIARMSSMTRHGSRKEHVVLV